MLKYFLLLCKKKAFNLPISLGAMSHRENNKKQAKFIITMHRLELPVSKTTRLLFTVVVDVFKFSSACVVVFIINIVRTAHAHASLKRFEKTVKTN